MTLLGNEMKLPIKDIINDFKKDKKYTPIISDTSIVRKNVYRIPYDEQGQKSSTSTSVLNVSVGERLFITIGKYKGDEGVVIMVGEDEGHIKIRWKHKSNNDTVIRSLGAWWLEAAVNGTVDVFPVMNVIDDDDD